jgi:hypothetical protein
MEIPFSGKGDVMRDKKVISPLFERTRLLVRLNHVGSRIVNANHSVMSVAVELCVASY